jgi:hypothetical protein
MAHQNYRDFVEFFLVWYSQQFAIPFWIVGHVHLHLNSYHDIIEILSSVVMHFMVAVGFWIDWRKSYQKEED